MTSVGVRRRDGLALAATCGLRAFLPLFAVGSLGALEHIELAESYQRTQRPTALIALGCAVLLEVAGDKFSVVDHLLDSAALVVKPVAAMVASASVMTDLDPMVTAFVGLLVGGTLAEGVHVVKAKVRLMSLALTTTLANPIVSFIEDPAALVGTAKAVLVPILVVVIAAVTGLWGIRWWIRRRQRPA